MYNQFGSLGSLKYNLYDWHGLNEKLFFGINGMHAGWYDSFMLTITQLGNHKLFIYYMAFFVFYAMVSTLARKLSQRPGLKVHIGKWVGILSVLLIGYGVMGFTVKTIKNEFQYPRPYQVYDLSNVTVLEEIDKDKAFESFPSGHSAFIAFIVTAIWPALGGGVGFFMVLIAMLVCWSRVALGVHFPADVVAGMTFGFLTTLIVRAVLYTLLRKLFKIPC